MVCSVFWFLQISIHLSSLLCPCRCVYNEEGWKWHVFHELFACQIFCQLIHPYTTDQQDWFFIIFLNTFIAVTLNALVCFWQNVKKEIKPNTVTFFVNAQYLCYHWWTRWRTQKHNSGDSRFSERVNSDSEGKMHKCKIESIEVSSGYHGNKHENLTTASGYHETSSLQTHFIRSLCEANITDDDHLFFAHTEYNSCPQCLSFQRPQSEK